MALNPGESSTQKSVGQDKVTLNQILFADNYTPHFVVGGYTGIGLSVRLSVRPSVCRRTGFRALDHYPYHLESPYRTYGLPIGGRCTLLILRSKGQRSSTLDIKVEIWFPGSKQLSLPPRVTISHIWTTHRRKMYPIDFEVKRSKVKRTGHQSRNTVSGL
jgi:hypothetical protein